MAKATNHNRKKAARKMARWRQRRREIAMRRAVALGVEFMKERLTAPSWMDLVLRRGEAYAFTKPEFVGEMPKPRLLGVVENFSPTGRRIEAIHELPRRDYYIPGKTQGEARLEGVDYGPLEIRCAALAYAEEDAEMSWTQFGIVHGRLSSGLPNFDNIPKRVQSAGSDLHDAVGRAVEVANARGASGEIDGSFPGVGAAFHEALDAELRKPEED